MATIVFLSIIQLLCKKLSKNDSFLHEVKIMKQNLHNLLATWPRHFIRDRDLAMLLNETDDARYSLVKRALKSGLLIRLRRGLYLIAEKTKQTLPDEFELALLIYGPSFVSLESALSYHGWIPETVYTTTCVSTKRAKEFKTPMGTFSYKSIPDREFYTGVDRITTQEGVIFVATPWRAIADLMYTKQKSWKNLEELQTDLRIDLDVVINSNRKQLALLQGRYPNFCVRKNLRTLLAELSPSLGKTL